MKTMLLTFSTVLSTLLGANAFAGAANAVFECSSASGRTKLSASVPGDFAEHVVTFSIDGRKSKYVDAIVQHAPYKTVKNSDILINGSMENKNYSFAITAPGNPSVVLFTLKAIPSSIKVKQISNGERGSLRAIIQGLDPREESPTVSKEIEVKCDYDYSI